MHTATVKQLPASAWNALINNELVYAAMHIDGLIQA